MIWYPPLTGPETLIQTMPPCDMAEPQTIWYGYPEVGFPATLKFPDSVTFDSVQKKIGKASVKLVTSRGYDLALNYRPAGDSLSHWQLSDTDTLYFWVRTIKQPQYGFQFFSVRIGDDHGNYYKYTASPSLLNAANLVWKRYKFPLSGNTQFSRSATGNMSLSEVNYVEIHADTWDYGFTLWVDGIQFNPCDPVTGIEPEREIKSSSLIIWPNPFNDKTTIRYHVNIDGPVLIELFNLQGIKIRTLENEIKLPGDYNIELNACDFGTNGFRKSGAQSVSGVYLLKLTTTDGSVTSKMVLIK